MKLRELLKNVFRRLGFDPVTKYDLSMSSLDMAIETVVQNQIEGDYLEFGVYKGGSFSRAYSQFKMRRSLKDRRFLAFDSFEGLPDSDEKSKPKQYQTGAYAASEIEFLRRIEERGVALEKVVTVPGFYDQTLTEETRKAIKLERVAIAYIDCDLYESTVPVLKFLTNVIQTGTVLVFDDWFRHKGVPGAGIQEACEEWLSHNPSISLHLLHQWRRMAFLVKVAS